MSEVSAQQLLKWVVERLPHAEHRPQQAAMTDVVAEAIAQESSLLCQAGTGVGKSIAVLAAAITSGQKTVYSTATRQLGNQLTTADVPVVVEALRAHGVDTPTVTLLKGRSNYLCLFKAWNEIDMSRQGDLLSTDGPLRETQQRQWKAVEDWAERTDSGDRSEAPMMIDEDWARLSVDSAACLGQKCPMVRDCFAEKARAAARDADLVVTNHALLALDWQSEQPLLHDTDVFVVDEAHDLERYCSTAWGASLTIRDLDATEPALRKLVSGKESASTLDAYRRASSAVADILDELSDGRLDELPENLNDHLAVMTRLLKNAQQQSDDTPSSGQSSGTQDELGSSGQVNQLLKQLGTLRAARGKAWVRWKSSFGDMPQLNCAPLHVGHQLQTAIDGRILIAVSATLSVAGNFSPIQKALGLTDARCVDVGSPFDYASQMWMHLPEVGFPVPAGATRADHSQAVLERITDLARAAGGRTLALFTTTRAAVDAVDHLRGSLPSTIRVIGHKEGAIDQLVSDFRSDETSVLCATMGMWSGLNVPGAACSVVVIDKIPFPPPDDVLTAARTEAAGSAGFREVSLAQAAIMLAQGSGRLIRRQDDKGVLAILDPRLLSKPYGRVLLATLPDCGVSRDPAAIVASLQRLSATRANSGTS